MKKTVEKANEIEFIISFDFENNRFYDVCKVDLLTYMISMKKYDYSGLYIYRRHALQALKNMRKVVKNG